MPTLPRMEVRLAHTESTAQGSHPQPEEARSRLRWSCSWWVPAVDQPHPQ